MNTALERARLLVMEATGLASDEIGDDAAIDNLPEWDSIAHVNIMLAIEGQLGRPLTPDSIMSVTSLDSIAKLLSGEKP